MLKAYAFNNNPTWLMGTRSPQRVVPLPEPPWQAVEKITPRSLRYS